MTPTARIITAAIVGSAIAAVGAAHAAPGDEPASSTDGPTDEELDETLGEVIIIEAEVAPRAHAAETTLDGEEAARIAGVQGDAIKAVRTLGGVARAAPGSEGITVWGASPADTRLYIDDIPVPRLFHLGGSRSVLPASSVSSLSLVPGGAGARYGRAIGGLVSIVTAAPDGTDHGLSASADAVDLGASAHARVGTDGWVAAGGRLGVLDRTFAAAAPARAMELIPIPSYWDYQARGGLRLAGGDELRIIGLGTSDEVTRGIPSVTPDAAFTETLRSSFHRVGARLTRRHADQTTMVLSVWAGIDRERQQMDFASVTASQNQRTVALGANLAEERRLHPRVLLRLGIDLDVRRTAIFRDGAISLPAREGDIGYFGQPPGNRVNRDEWTVRQVGVGTYASAEITAGAGIVLEPGLRFEPSVIDGNRVLPVRPTEPAVGYTELAVAIDPRLRATWTPRSSMRLYAAAGRYHQPPSPADLSPIFGSPILAPAEAWQALAGIVATPGARISAELVGFGVVQRALAVRSALATPPIAGLLVSEGRGRTIGAQLSIRTRPLNGLAAWLSYSLMRSQRLDHPGMAWRRFDGDQTHLVQGAMSWSHSSGLEVGGRLEVASGAPRTAVIGALFDAGSQRHDPIFGDHNGTRLPAFASLSLRAAWGRRTGWGRFSVWLDVQNLTNRSNAEEIFYAADFARSDYVRGLPILPVVGAEVEL